MAHEVEFTPEFEVWWNGLETFDQENVSYSVSLLTQFGPALARPHADTLKGCKYPNLKELRVRSGGKPIRVMYAFDPRRVALLLVGGTKGDSRWYEVHIRQAEQLYAAHLSALKDSG